MSGLSSATILKEVQRQKVKVTTSTPSTVISSVIDKKDNAEENDVDILTYVRAGWGLNERPYPVQRFLLKVLYCLPLDDRFDDSVEKWLSPNSFKPSRIDQFEINSVMDIGKHKKLTIQKIDSRDGIIYLNQAVLEPSDEGQSVFLRITIWDKFRSRIEGSFTEKEFITYLYGDGPGHDNCRINLSLEDYEKRVAEKKISNLVILRIGRRGTKCLRKDTLCTTNQGLLTLEELQKRFVS